MLTGRIKRGAYWSKIPGHTHKAYCTFCKKATNTDVIETESHMWLECEHSGQAQAWETTKRIWRKSTDRDWPDISLGLIRGVGALTFEGDYNKDSERLRILISMTIWAIWKSKIKNSINSQDVAPNETSGVLKGLIADLIIKSWNATRFKEGGRRESQRRDIRKLWSDERLTNFDLKTGPTIDFS